MVNILEVKKQKEIDETFIFIGKVSDLPIILKVKAKTADDAKVLMRNYAEKVGKKINEESSYLFNISAIDKIDTLTQKDLEE